MNGPAMTGPPLRLVSPLHNSSSEVFPGNYRGHIGRFDIVLIKWRPPLPLHQHISQAAICPTRPACPSNQAAGCPRTQQECKPKTTMLEMWLLSLTNQGRQQHCPTAHTPVAVATMPRGGAQCSIQLYCRGIGMHTVLVQHSIDNGMPTHHKLININPQHDELHMASLNRAGCIISTARIKSSMP